eukprot:COSAG05_NODE_1426_length_4919_cov_280.452075_7_plen_70_part_00
MATAPRVAPRERTTTSSLLLYSQTRRDASHFLYPRPSAFVGYDTVDLRNNNNEHDVLLTPVEYLATQPL